MSHCSCQLFRICGGFFAIIALSATALSSQFPTGSSLTADESIDSVLKCELLLKANIQEATVISAKVETPGYLTHPWCRVELIRQAASGRSIAVWYGLPTQGWNGRFLGTGGAAYSAGFPDFDGLATDGFMVGATDAGRTKRGWEAALDGSFALDAKGRLDWPVIANFGHIAIHEMTITGKELAQLYYGSAPRFAYFSGCSQGGRQGLMEAQRYPGDYDGIVAGAPAIFLPKLHVGMLWAQLVMAKENHIVDRCKLGFVTRSVIQVCDKDDGLIDGLISDPGSCQFDARSLIDSANSECGQFTEIDADIVNLIWAGAKRQNGEFLWYGPRRGASLTELANSKGVPLVGQPSPILLDWVKYFLLQNPDWNWQQLTSSKFEQLYDQSVSQYTDVIGAENPDLSAFKQQGGKLLVWHGDADQAIPPDGSIDYFNKVSSTLGGHHQLTNFFRLFMAPGVAHCEGGNGLAPQNLMDTLIQWVEYGNPPDQLLASTQDKKDVHQRTRPLCPYPLIARFDGKGDPDEADSFSCVFK